MPKSNTNFHPSQYVVDGSIHPDLPTGNIQTTIMVIAEAAAARILAQH